MNCFRHPTEPKKGCRWCKSWYQTYNYFKAEILKNNLEHVLTLYCVKMTHYRTGEKFYKIGLTSKSVDERFDDLRERFIVDVEWNCVYPLYHAVTHEKELLYKYQVTEGRKYIPKAKFNGQSECISLS